MINIKNLKKDYHTKEGEINAIKDISININKNDIISIIGPSGCGKSTILSILAELDKDYKGNIIKNSNTQVGYMMQNDALLPFLTIYDNIILGLKIQNKLNSESIEYINNLINLYNLEEFKDKYPNSLSGGMRQRCSLIRTLALKPNVLLLDEPFSSLDEKTRMIISNDIYNYARCNNITIVLITHSINEAIYFSNRVIILSQRPSIIKKEINIDIPMDISINERRSHNKFNEYYDILYKELDNNE